MKYSVVIVSVLLTIFSQVYCQSNSYNFPLGGVDLDGDGFFSLPSNGRFHDCCDSVLDGCPDPFLVNPGAFDVPNNGINDRCSYNCLEGEGVPYDGVFCEQFRSDSLFPCDAQNEEHNLIGTDTRSFLTEKAVLAMDICEFKDDDDDPSWGFERQYNLYFSLADGTRNGWDIGITGPNDLQASVLKSFGRIGPIYGNTMVGISSGSANAAFQTSGQNYLFNPNGASFGSTLVNLPTEFQNDDPIFNPTCPVQSTGLFDSIMGTMNIVQPTNMHSYSIKVLYLDNEVTYDSAFEDFCDVFQSAFIIFTNGTGRNNNDGGNIALDVNGDQIRSYNPNRNFYTQCAKWTGDWPDNTCYDSEIHLEFSNFEYASNWIPVGTSALPREIFELQFLTFDAQNGNVDTTVLLDDYRVMYEARAGFVVPEVTCATSYDGKPNPIYNSQGYPYCDFLQTPYGYQYTGDIALVSMIPTHIGIYPQGTKTITFNFVVRNEGPEYAGDVTLYMTPPLGTKFNSTTGDFSCSVYQAAEPPYVDNSFYKCKTAQNYPLSPHETYSGSITYTLTYPKAQPIGRSEISFRLTAATSSIDVVFGNNHITQLIKIDI